MFRHMVFLGLQLSLFLFGAVNTAAATFTNPIGSGNDPWVKGWNGDWYYCSSNGRAVNVHKADKLQDVVRNSVTQVVKVWVAPDTGMWSKNVWAPELHYLGGKWYVYIAADSGKNEDHRAYVLEGTSQNPQDPFVFKGKIRPTTDRWAIDATVLTLGAKNYLVWSGWEGGVNVRQNLYIAPMSNPWTISGERAMISTPQYDWEKRGGSPAINEGPQVLQRGKDTFIIYSASGSWSDYYCLGQLRLTGSNPMLPSAWKKHDKSVFSSTKNVFGPGHCSFAKSPDSTENWIIYHAAVAKGSGWKRNIRMQKFGWNTDGSPNFGMPVSEGTALQLPSEKPTAILAQAPREGAGLSGIGAYQLRMGWYTGAGLDLLGRDQALNILFTTRP